MSIMPMQKKVLAALIFVILLLGIIYVLRQDNGLLPQSAPEATIRSRDIADRVIDVAFLQDKKAYLTIFKNGAQYVDATSFGVGDKLSIRTGAGAVQAATAAVEVDGNLYMITQKGELSKYDPNTLIQEGNVLRLFAGNNRLVGAPLEDMLLVSNREASVITIVDLATFSILNTVPVGALPGPMAFDPYTNLVYVANQGDGSISVISLDSKLTVANFGDFGEPVDLLLQPERSGLLVLDKVTGNLFAVDLRTNSVVDELFTLRAPAAMAIAPNFPYVVVISSQQPIAMVVDIETVKTFPSFELSDNFAPGGLLDIIVGNNNEFLVTASRSKVFGVRLNSP